MLLLPGQIWPDQTWIEKNIKTIKPPPELWTQKLIKNIKKMLKWCSDIGLDERLVFFWNARLVNIRWVSLTGNEFVCSINKRLQLNGLLNVACLHLTLDKWTREDAHTHTHAMLLSPTFSPIFDSPLRSSTWLAAWSFSSTFEHKNWEMEQTASYFIFN